MKQSEADRAVEFFNTSNEVVATDADGAFELAVDSVSVVFGGNEVVRAETFSDDIRIVLRPAKQGDTLVAVKVTSSCSQGGQPCTGFWSAVKWIRVSDPPGALAVSRRPRTCSRSIPAPVRRAIQAAWSQTLRE